MSWREALGRAGDGTATAEDAALLLREAPLLTLAAARRKAVTLRFALVGSERLRRLLDPASGDATGL